VLSVFAVTFDQKFAAQFVHPSPGNAADVRNLPAAHAAPTAVVFVIASGGTPLYPGFHKQSVTASLPSGHAEFTGQPTPVPTLVEPTALENTLFVNSVQLCGPGAALNVPARQRVHATPLAPMLFAGQAPALHVQFWITPLDAGELEFDGHVSHWL
jgi:hypothetical protein